MCLLCSVCVFTVQYMCVYSAIQVCLLFSLEELHISLNDLRHIEVTEETPYPALHLLHISTNGLTDWEDIEKLGRFFPNLEQLFMIENPIREISQENLAASFLNLEGINISGTAVASWKELEKFRHFPKLRAIRLKGIPLLEVLFSFPVYSSLVSPLGCTKYLCLSQLYF